MYLMRIVMTFLIAFTIAAAAAGEGAVESWTSSEDGLNRLSPGEPIALRKAPRRVRGDVIVVDPTTTYQRILGLGASLEHATCYNLSRLSPALRDEVIEKLVHPEKGIGMNLMRLCIGASDFIGEPYYSYSDLPEGETDPELKGFSIEKDRAYVLPIIKKVQETNPDLLFFASPWSPPGWMKDSGTMCGGRLKREYYDVYARYLIRYLEAYQAEGVPIHALTLQNEPRMEHPGYPTCLWTGEEQRDFIRDHFGPMLARSPFSPHIWCWDHNWNLLAFPRAVLRDPEAATYVEGTAFHHYEGRVDAQSTLREEFPDKHIYFSEGSTFRTTGAVRIINILRHWSRSYNAWVIMLDEHRKPNNGPHSASATCVELKDDLSVEYRFDYYMYGQFMKFIPRGSLRIESSEAERFFAQVAFKTPDGAIVLVAANAGSADRPFTVRCGDDAFTTVLAPKSVATYRWRME